MTMLMQNESKPGFVGKMFRKPTFTYPNLLRRAKSMAEALAYLHGGFHEGAVIIHRGTLFGLIFL
jgi:hypothetical protein